ncbi:FlgO family outer membrane protein [Ferrimonas pelagia]|uniref:FlgO family outer membrane protein n=1 Tax=Ferrimonas pelagia TaxID=1177826 RepID=A0ABP9F1C2_9GAMM
MRWVAVLLAGLLTACAPFGGEQQYSGFDDGGKPLPPQGAINALADRIAVDLMRHHSDRDGEPVLAITTPVMLDEYERSSAFSLQLGEAMVAALHQQGMQVVDLNGSDRVRIGERGNLLLSRDVTQLSSEMSVDQVLVATVARSRDGVQIHSRILSVANNRVLSASQGQVPWQQLPAFFRPAGLVSMEQGRLYRHADGGRGTVIEWERAQ